MQGRPLPTLPSRAEVLLDSNVLAYALLGRSPQCAQLLRRCLNRDVSGFTTIEILSEVCHRLMLFEAFGKGLINRQNASSLKGKRAAIATLTEYWRSVHGLPAMGLAVLPLDEHRFVRAHDFRRAHGLMTNDSIILAAADVFGIVALATNDDDFDGVAWAEIYKPTDIAGVAP